MANIAVGNLVTHPVNGVIAAISPTQILIQTPDLEMVVIQKEDLDENIGYSTGDHGVGCIATRDSLPRG